MTLVDRLLSVGGMNFVPVDLFLSKEKESHKRSSSTLLKYYNKSSAILIYTLVSVSNTFRFAEFELSTSVDFFALVYVISGLAVPKKTINKQKAMIKLNFLEK